MIRKGVYKSIKEDVAKNGKKFYRITLEIDGVERKYNIFEGTKAFKQFKGKYEIGDIITIDTEKKGEYENIKSFISKEQEDLLETAKKTPVKIGEGMDLRNDKEKRIEAMFNKKLNMHYESMAWEIIKFLSKYEEPIFNSAEEGRKKTIQQIKEFRETLKKEMEK